MKLVIAGGGTGGHLFPGIAVAEEFLARDPSHQVLFVGAEQGIEGKVLPSSGYPHRFIPAGGIRGKGTLARIRGGVLLLLGYGESRKILKEFAPHLVLGVGGYASAPLVLAARGMQIPCFIHEQNAIPGSTNRLLGTFARRIYLSIPGSERFFPEGRCLVTGNPVRRSLIASCGTKPERNDSSTLNLLVFGGSRGAHAINVAMIEALPFLASLRGTLAIRHQTGSDDLTLVKDGYGKNGFAAEVTPFIDDMGRAYDWADLIVCRAGATTIAETTLCGRPCIFIPFPHATDDHQRRNAEALLGADACRMIVERELTGERLALEIKELASDRGALERMGMAARKLAYPDAARRIVDDMMASVTVTGETGSTLD